MFLAGKVRSSAAGSSPVGRRLLGHGGYAREVGHLPVTPTAASAAAARATAGRPRPGATRSSRGTSKISSPQHGMVTPRPSQRFVTSAGGWGSGAPSSSTCSTRRWSSTAACSPTCSPGRRRRPRRSPTTHRWRRCSSGCSSSHRPRARTASCSGPRSSPVRHCSTTPSVRWPVGARAAPERDGCAGRPAAPCVRCGGGPARDDP